MLLGGGYLIYTSIGEGSSVNGGIGPNTGYKNIRAIYPTSGGKIRDVVSGGSVEYHSGIPRREWEINCNGLLNIEATGYFLVSGGKEEISIKVRGGNHTGSGDNSTTRQGCCYIMDVPFPQPNDDTNFAKECPHPDYCKVKLPTKFNPGNIMNRWIGAKFIVWNVSNGVRLQGYLDTGNNRLVQSGGQFSFVPSNQWKLWFETTDTGQFGCGQAAGSKPPFTHAPWSGSLHKVIYRVDVTQVKSIGLHVREIVAPGMTGSRLATMLDRNSYVVQRVGHRGTASRAMM